MPETKSGVKTAGFSIVRPAVLAVTFSGRSIKYARQQRLNAAFAGLYAVQALIVFMLGKSATAPVNLNYLARDPLESAAAGKPVLLLAQHHLFDVSLLGFAVVFLLCSAVFHGLLATVLRTRYEQGLINRLCDLRWTGYAVLGSFAAVLTALLLGVSDAALLIGLIGLCVLMAYGAMAVEANKKLWPWGIFGVAAVAAAIAALLCYVFGAGLYGTALPPGAYIAFAITLMAAAVIAASLWLQIHHTGKWTDFAFAETVYLANGFAASSLLAWALYAGVLR